MEFLSSVRKLPYVNPFHVQSVPFTFTKLEALIHLPSNCGRLFFELSRKMQNQNKEKKCMQNKIKPVFILPFQAFTLRSFTLPHHEHYSLQARSFFKRSLNIRNFFINSHRSHYELDLPFNHSIHHSRPPRFTFHVFHSLLSALRFRTCLDFFTYLFCFELRLSQYNH